MSGAWEYIRPGEWSKDSGDPASIAAALGMMDYDVGFLSGKEAAMLADAGVTPPDWQQTAGQAPFTRVATPNGDVGFLRFPSLPSGKDEPTPEILERLERAVRRHLDEVGLLIGLSDWGWLAEQEYMSSDPGAVPDLLLGSGRGSGVNGRIQADGRCLWFRAYDKGRTIVEINILEWPDRENPFAWTPSKNYTSASTGLNDTIEDYPAVRDVLQ